MLVDGTNEYARSRIDEMSRTGKLKEKWRWRRWKDTTLDELKKVLAVVVNMGIIQVPELEMYWKTAWESNIPFFHDVLSRNRFEEIFWMLHLPLSTTATQTRLTKSSLSSSTCWYVSGVLFILHVSFQWMRQ